jgi:hypothetical protein
VIFGRSLAFQKHKSFSPDHSVKIPARATEPNARGRVSRSAEVASHGGGMNTYNFNVLKRDETVAAIQSFSLGNSRAIWPKVAELAWSVGEVGGQIRVTDQAGSVVVLVGVNSARRVSRFSIAVSGEASRAA